MKLEWLGKYRELVGLIYRSANAYSALCKTEGLGDNIKISPYEVQILEFIMEYENENNNMTWFANKMGISTSTYSKYVNRLVTKGMVEKYRTTGNKKNIVLRVSPLGQQEYRKYAEYAEKTWFHQLFEKLDSVPPEHLETFKDLVKIWGGWSLKFLTDEEEQVKLLKVERKA